MRPCPPPDSAQCRRWLRWQGAGVVVTTALSYTFLVDAFLRDGKLGEALTCVNEGLRQALST